MQGEGLSEQYKEEENETLRRDFHSLIALAFVPEADVDAVFDKLSDSLEEDSLLPVFDHVEDYYVKGRRRGRGRSAPMFAPSTWNCYERVLEGHPRTTNTAEAWHRRLNTIVASPLSLRAFGPATGRSGRDQRRSDSRRRRTFASPQKDQVPEDR